MGPEPASTWDWAAAGEPDDIVAYYRNDPAPGKGAPESPDQGPWEVRDWGAGRLVLQSDDFEADAALELSGDFESPEAKRAYAQALAAWMNHHLGVTPRPHRKDRPDAARN